MRKKKPMPELLRSYQLHFIVKERVKISVGALGDFELPAGLYVYTGSAKRNILARVSRHLSGKKKIRWHIDYLLSHPLARIIDVKLLEKDECEANQELEGQILIPRFGASDCRRRCGSHLKYLGEWPADAEGSDRIKRSRCPFAPRRTSAMGEGKIYTSGFVNRYGEEWRFEYDSSTGEGILKGSDVNWQPYRVVNGHAVGLLLNEEELAWLKKAWAEATSK
jgi:Uri superfamily endonuclease